MFLLIRTLEFSAFTFANIGILNFAFSIQCNSVFYLFQTFDFPLLVPEFFQTLEFNVFLFPNIASNSEEQIEIQSSAFCKHWNTRILPFEKFHFSVFVYLNIGILDFGFFNIRIQCFGFSKHRNCEFWFFQTLEFWVLAFSTLEYSVFWFFQTPHVCKKNVNREMFV